MERFLERKERTNLAQAGDVILPHKINNILKALVLERVWKDARGQQIRIECDNTEAGHEERGAEVEMCRGKQKQKKWLRI